MSEAAGNGNGRVATWLAIALSAIAVVITVAVNLIGIGSSRGEVDRRLIEHDNRFAEVKVQLTDLRVAAERGHEEQKSDIKTLERLVVARAEIVSMHSIELQAIARRLEVNERAIAAVAAMDSRLSGIEAQLKGIERMVEVIVQRERAGERRGLPP